MTSNAPARRPPPAARRVAVNALYLGYDKPWCRSPGDLLTTGVAVVAGVVTLIRSVLHRSASRPAGRQRS